MGREIMKFALLFTSQQSQLDTVMTTADTHGLTLIILAQHHGITEWIIDTELNLAGLCNFVNDLGALNVYATCSMR